MVVKKEKLEDRLRSFNYSLGYQLEAFKASVPYVSIDSTGKVIEVGNLKEVFPEDICKQVSEGSFLGDIRGLKSVTDYLSSNEDEEGGGRDKEELRVRLEERNLIAKVRRFPSKEYFIIFKEDTNTIHALFSLALHNLNNRISGFVQSLDLVESFLSRIGQLPGVKEVYSSLSIFNSAVNSLTETSQQLGEVFSPLGSSCQSLEDIVEEIFDELRDSEMTCESLKREGGFVKRFLVEGGENSTAKEYSFKDVNVVRLPFKEILYTLSTNAVDGIKDFVSKKPERQQDSCVKVFTLVENGLLKRIGVSNIGMRMPYEVEGKLFKEKVTSKSKNSDFFGGTGEGLVNAYKLAPVVVAEFERNTYRGVGLEYVFSPEEGEDYGEHSFYVTFEKYHF